MQETQAARTIGKYKILSTLGRGSMGVVYKGQDPEIGRIVAIKILRKISASTDQTEKEALERFKIEARAAGNLRHPNIITVFEVNTERDTPYLVMDYIEGESLSAVIKKHGMLDPLLVCNFLRQIASGLDYAHSKGVIHRDIKPGNILIDRSQNAFILDFGVASIGSRSAESDEPIMGTPSYMSPEQIRHQELDGRSDIFSLAITAFECLSGKKPFGGDNINAVVNNIINARQHSLLDFVPNLSLEIDVLLEKALAKNKNERFQTATHMIESFSQALGLEVSTSGAYQFSPDKISGIAGLGSSATSSSFSQQKSSGVYQRERQDTPNKGLSAWRPESRSVKANSFSMTDAPASKELRPGSIYETHDDSFAIERPQRQFYKYAIGGVIAMCVLTTGYAFYKAITQETFRERENRVTQVVVDEISDAVKTNPVFMDIKDPQYQIPDAGKSAVSMTDLELMGVLMQEQSKESLIFEALHEVSKRRLEDIVAAAQHLLKRDSYAIKVETLKVLSSKPDPRVVPAVVLLLDDYDPIVRRAAAKTLGDIADKRSVGYLQARVLREEVAEVKKEIRSTIEKITGIPYAG